MRRRKVISFEEKAKIEPELQWGRLHAEAESCHAFAREPASRPLQWGRLHAEAESRGIACCAARLPARFNGAASMRRRKA